MVPPFMYEIKQAQIDDLRRQEALIKRSEIANLIIAACKFHETLPPKCDIRSQREEIVELERILQNKAQNGFQLFSILISSAPGSSSRAALFCLHPLWI